MEGLRLREYAPTDKDSLSGPDPLPERTPSITEVTKAPITYYPSSANPDLFSTGFESVSNIGAGPRARARGAMETAVIELLEDTEEDESPEYESFVRGTFGAIVEGVEKRRASLKVSLNSDLERKKQSMGFRGLFSREKVEERSLDLVHRDIDQDTEVEYMVLGKDGVDLVQDIATQLFDEAVAGFNADKDVSGLIDVSSRLQAFRNSTVDQTTGEPSKVSSEITFLFNSIRVQYDKMLRSAAQGLGIDSRLTEWYGDIDVAQLTENLENAELRVVNIDNLPKELREKIELLDNASDRKVREARNSKQTPAAIKLAENQQAKGVKKLTERIHKEIYGDHVKQIETEDGYRWETIEETLTRYAAERMVSDVNNRNKEKAREEGKPENKVEYIGLETIREQCRQDDEDSPKFDQDGNPISSFDQKVEESKSRIVASYITKLHEEVDSELNAVYQREIEEYIPYEKRTVVALSEQLDHDGREVVQTNIAQPEKSLWKKKLQRTPIGRQLRRVGRSLGIDNSSAGVVTGARVVGLALTLAGIVTAVDEFRNVDSDDDGDNPFDDFDNFADAYDDLHSQASKGFNSLDDLVDRIVGNREHRVDQFTSSDTDDIEHTKSTSDSSDVIANVRASMDDDLTPRQEEMRQRLMDDDGDHEVRVADSDVRPLVYRDIDTDETEADLTEEETIDITEGLPAGTQEVTVEAQPEPFILSLTINGEVYQYKIDASAILDTLEQIGIREEAEKAYIPDSLDFRIGDIFFHIASDTADQASLQDAPDFETTFNPKALEPLLNSPALETAGNGILEVVLDTIGDQAAKWGLEKQWEEALEMGETYAPLMRALVELGVEIAPDEDIEIELNTGDLKPFGELLKHGIKANVEGDIVGELEKAGEKITIALADGEVGTYTDSHEAITALYDAVMKQLPDDFELTIEGTDGDILLKKGEAVDPRVLVRIFSDPQHLNLIQEELEKQDVNIFKLVGLVETADGGYELPEGTEEAIIQIAKSAVEVAEGLQQPSGDTTSPLVEPAVEPVEELPIVTEGEDGGDTTSPLVEPAVEPEAELPAVAEGEDGGDTTAPLEEPAEEPAVELPIVTEGEDGGDTTAPIEEPAVDPAEELPAATEGEVGGDTTAPLVEPAVDPAEELPVITEGVEATTEEEQQPIIEYFKVSAGESLSKILNDAGLMTNDLYGDDGAIKQLETNSIAVIDGKAYILVNDDPSTTAKVFNVINPRSDMQGTPEGARLIVLDLPDNVSTDTDSLIDNILNPVRNVLRNQELTIGDGQTLDDAFDTVLESVNREVHNLPEEVTVENNVDTTPVTSTNTANIPFVATPGEPQTQEFVDTASDHWQSRIEELDDDQLEQRISDSQTTLNNVRLATEQEKDTLHERQIINVYSARMLSQEQIAQLGDITPELVAQYEGDIAELLTVEFGMNGSIAKQVAAVIENAPTVEIINRVLELKGVETAQTTTETAQVPVEAPEIPVAETSPETVEVPEVVPSEETVEQIPTEVAETAAEVPPFVLPELPEETVTETPEQAEEPQEEVEVETEAEVEEQPEVTTETVETPEAPLAEPGVVEEELKFPEFMQITFNINGIEQTYRISTAQISEILQNVGYENEVLEAYIPDNISGSIAGISFTISSEGADADANTPVIDSSFNPAALAALTGNQDLVDAAEGLYQKILDIVGDQAAKMGLENAFETAMAEAGKYESLAKALVALGIENAPNEDVKINIEAGPLAPFGRLIQEGIQSNVNGDFSGLEAAGQEITVLLQDGSVGTFVNSHVAVDELYNTVTSLLPDGYELVIEGENGDIVLGKGHEIPAEVLVQVLSDPKYLNLIQQELEDKGINIFNLVGLNQTEEGKIEIPQSTIDTFKAIVEGVAGAVTAGAEALDEADSNVQPEDGEPTDTDAEVPQFEAEQPVAEEAPAAEAETPAGQPVAEVVPDEGAPAEQPVAEEVPAAEAETPAGQPAAEEAPAAEAETPAGQPVAEVVPDEGAPAEQPVAEEVPAEAEVEPAEETLPAPDAEPQLFTITLTYNNQSSTYSLDAGQMLKVLEQMGLDDVEGSYIPESFNFNVGGIGEGISVSIASVTAGDAATQNHPDFATTFNPAALSSLVDSPEIETAINGIVGTVLEIASDQAAQHGLEEMFKQAVEQGEIYAPLVEALAEVGVEALPDGEVEIDISTGELKPIGELLKHAAIATVEVDEAGLGAAAQEFRVMLPDGSWETYPNAVEAMTALGETITSLLPDGYEIVVDGQIILTGGEAVDPQVLMNILTNPAQLNRIIEELNKVEVPEELREQGLNLFKMVGLAVTEGQIPEGAVDAGVDMVGPALDAAVDAAGPLLESLLGGNDQQPAEEPATGAPATEVEPAEEAPAEAPAAEEAPVEQPAAEETPVEQPVAEEAPVEQPVAEEAPIAEPSDGSVPADDEADTEGFWEQNPITRPERPPVEYHKLEGLEGTQNDYEWRFQSFIGQDEGEDVKFYMAVVNDISDTRNNSDFDIIFQTPTTDNPDGSIQISYKYGDYVNPGYIQVYSDTLIGLENLLSAGIDLNEVFTHQTPPDGIELTEEQQALFNHYNEGRDKVKDLIAEADDLFRFIMDFSEAGDETTTPPTVDSTPGGTSDDGGTSQPDGSADTGNNEQHLPDEENGNSGSPAGNPQPRVEELSNSARDVVRNFVDNSMQSGDAVQIGSAIRVVAEMDNPDPEMVGSVLDYFVNNKEVFLNPDYSQFETILRLMESNEDNSFNVNGREIIVSDEIDALKSDLRFENIFRLGFRQQDRAILLHEIFPDENTEAFLRQIIDDEGIYFGSRHHALQVLSQIGEAELEDYREHYDEVVKWHTAFTYEKSHFLHDLIEMSPELGIDLGEETVRNLEALAQKESEDPTNTFNAMHYESTEVPGFGIPYELTEDHVGRLLNILNSEDYSVMAKHNAVGILINSNSQLTGEVVDVIVDFINSLEIKPDTNTLYIERYISGLMNSSTPDIGLNVIQQLLEGQTQNPYLTSMLMLYKANSGATPETIDRFLDTYNDLTPYEKSKLAWELARIPEIDSGLTEFIYSQLQFEDESSEGLSDAELIIKANALRLILSEQVELTEDGIAIIKDMALNDEWLNLRLAAMKLWHINQPETGELDVDFLNTFRELIRKADSNNNGYFDMYQDSRMVDEIEPLLKDPRLMETLLEMIEGEDLEYDEKLWDPVILHMQRILLESADGTSGNGGPGQESRGVEDGTTGDAISAREALIDSRIEAASNQTVGGDSGLRPRIGTSVNGREDGQTQAADADGLVSNEEWSRTVEDAFMDSTYKPERRTLSEEWKDVVNKFEDIVAEVGPEIKVKVENVTAYLRENPINVTSLKTMGLSLSGLVLSTVVAMTGKVKRGKQTRPRTISFTPAEVLQNDLSRADNSTAIKFALGQSGVVEIRPSNTQAIVFNPSNGTVSRTRLYGYATKENNERVTLTEEQEMRLLPMYSNDSIPRRSAINYVDTTNILRLNMDDLRNAKEDSNRENVQGIIEDLLFNGRIDSQFPAELQAEIISERAEGKSLRGIFESTLKKITDMFIRGEVKFELGQMEDMPEGLKIPVLKLRKI